MKLVSNYIYVMLININERNNYLARIAKSARIEYAYSCRIIRKLEDSGIIKYKEDCGRIKYLYLTEKGIIIRDLLIKLKPYENMIKAL